MPTRVIRKVEGPFWLGIQTAMCALAWRVIVGSFQESDLGSVDSLSGLFVAFGLTRAVFRDFFIPLKKKRAVISEQ
jgi:hypothetical protein